MNQIRQKSFSLAIAVTLLYLQCIAFADDNQPNVSPTTPSYPGYTQIKPEPPQTQNRIPEQPRFTVPNRDMTLLDGPVQEPIPVSEYWIGVQCEEVMPALRYHLNLDEQEGMLVEQVVPESPAARAGVQQYDVILAVNDKPVKALADIIKAVGEVKDGELTMNAIRRGKPLELKVTPEKRPDNAKLPAIPPRQRMFRSIEPGVIIEGMPPGSPDMPQQDIPENIRQMMEQMQKQMEEQMRNFPDSGRFRIESMPLMPGFAPPLGGFGRTNAAANTIQISIEPARGDMEASLTIRKNGQTWSVSHFSDLPENVQKDVAEVLENTVDGKDVADWIADQLKSNRRMTFSVTVSDSAQEPQQTDEK